MAARPVHLRVLTTAVLAAALVTACATTTATDVSAPTADAVVAVPTPTPTPDAVAEVASPTPAVASPATDEPSAAATASALPPLPPVSSFGVGAAWFGHDPNDFVTEIGLTLEWDAQHVLQRDAFPCGALVISDPAYAGAGFTVVGPDDGFVARIDVVGGAWRTDEGIGIGASTDEVLAAHGEGVVTTLPDGSSEWRWSNDAERLLVVTFDTGGSVVAIRAGIFGWVDGAQDCA